MGAINGHQIDQIDFETVKQGEGVGGLFGNQDDNFLELCRGINFSFFQISENFFFKLSAIFGASICKPSRTKTSPLRITCLNYILLSRIR